MGPKARSDLKPDLASRARSVAQPKQDEIDSISSWPPSWRPRSRPTSATQPCSGVPGGGSRAHQLQGPAAASRDGPSHPPLGSELARIMTASRPDSPAALSANGEAGLVDEAGSEASATGESSPRMEAERGLSPDGGRGDQGATRMPLRANPDSPPASGLRRPLPGSDSGLLGLTEGAAPIVSAVAALPWWDQEEQATERAKELALQVRETCQSVKHLTDMMMVLHSQALASETFAFQVAFLFGSLSQLELSGVKCRNIFLRQIQDDFGRFRDLARSAQLNLVTLLCQVFRRVRVADGTTIDALSEPIMTCLLDILDHPDELGLSVLAKQVQIVGPELERIVPEALAGLLRQVRQCVVHAGTHRLTSPSLATLLLLIELSVSGWQMGDTLEAFYASQMPTYARFAPMAVSNTNVVVDNRPHGDVLPLQATQEKNLALLAALSMQSAHSLDPPRQPPMILPDVSMPPPNFRPIHPGAPPLNSRLPNVRPSNAASWGHELMGGRGGEKASSFLEPRDSPGLYGALSSADPFSTGPDMMGSLRTPANGLSLNSGLGPATSVAFGLMNRSPGLTAPTPHLVPWSTGSNDRNEPPTAFNRQWSRSNSMKEDNGGHRGRGPPRQREPAPWTAASPSGPSVPSGPSGSGSDWSSEPTWRPPPPSTAAWGEESASTGTDWGSSSTAPPPSRSGVERSSGDLHRASSFHEASNVGLKSDLIDCQAQVSDWSPGPAADEISGWGSPAVKDSSGSGWGSQSATSANGHTEGNQLHIDTWGGENPEDKANSHIHVSAKPWAVD